MLSLNIPIPHLPGRQEIEIEIAMEGRRHKLHYRVEVIRWEDGLLPDEKRVEVIRDLLELYDPHWVIYHIGVPTEEYVPLTFIKRDDWVTQLNWMWQKS